MSSDDERIAPGDLSIRSWCLSRTGTSALACQLVSFGGSLAQGQRAGQEHWERPDDPIVANTDGEDFTQRGLVH